MLAQQSLDEYENELNILLSKRFNYVFVDEYQDCDELQCRVIDRLFNTKNTVVQKIGDADQAIYSGVKSEEIPWKVSGDALQLLASNRYHQKIANELIKLRTNNEAIISLNNASSIDPALIVFEETKIKDVLKTFVALIEEYDLQKLVPNGKYKAVGMIKNGTGITIGDYWDEYKKEEMGSNKLVLDDYVHHIVKHIMSGNLSAIEKCVRKMLCQTCYLTNRKDENSNRYFTFNSIKNGLFTYDEFDYKNEILGISKIDEADYDVIREYLINTIRKVIMDEKDMQLLNDFIASKTNFNQSDSQFVNRWTNDRRDIKVDFSTVYKVKGETHTATLYLETVTDRASDLKRIMPLFKGMKMTGTSPLYEKSRKVAYVGFSRPTHLLCVAMQNETFCGNEKAFENWRVIKL